MNTYLLTHNDRLNELNIDYFEKAKVSLKDPLGLMIANDVNWIKLENNWNHSKFPVVIGGKGDPIIFLHGFDSSFLEFRRIYPLLKNNFQVIIPDLLGFGFTPRFATTKYSPTQIISNLKDILNAIKITKKIKVVGASMGASVALKLTNEIPNLIDKNTFISCRIIWRI